MTPHRLIIRARDRSTDDPMNLREEPRPVPFPTPPRTSPGTRGARSRGARSRGARRGGVLAAVGVVVGIIASLALASSASAHVQVSGTDTTRGGEGVVSFRVPTESATASTVGLTITFPASTPIVSALTQPVLGWSATVTTAPLTKPMTTDDGTVDTYVTSVAWKAESSAAGIQPGSFQTFSVSVSPLPDQPTVTFPVLQRYSDGSTVDWNETSVGGAEPAHPAPVLTLAPTTAPATAPATPSPGGGHGTANSTHATEQAAAGHAASAGPATNAGTVWTAAAALVAGLLGLLAGVIALARTYRRPPRSE